MCLVFLAAVISVKKHNRGKIDFSSWFQSFPPWCGGCSRTEIFIELRPTSIAECQKKGPGYNTAPKATPTGFLQPGSVSTVLPPIDNLFKVWIHLWIKTLSQWPHVLIISGNIFTLSEMWLMVFLDILSAIKWTSKISASGLRCSCTAPASISTACSHAHVLHSDTVSFSKVPV